MKRKIKPVRALTFKGKLLVAVIYVIGRFFSFFAGKRWNYPPVGFHDDPAEFKPRDILFFGYKYYIKTLENAEKNSGLEEYFRTMEMEFPKAPENAKTITLSCGGDLMPYEWINKESTQYLWDEVGDFFFDADIVFANLETPFNTEKPLAAVPEVMLYDMYFNGSDELFDIFSGNGKYKGFDVLSTINNHTYDMGEEGITKTIEYLEGKGIQHVGSSRTAKEQDEIPIVNRQGVKIAFLAYTYSLNKLKPVPGREYMVNLLPLNQPGCDIELIKKHARIAHERGADMVVCSLHCGCAYQAYPASHTVDLYHTIFEEAGVDVILGHHPHNPQPMEQYPFTDPFSGRQKTGFAIYSLGDFVAYDLNIYCRMPLMLKLRISKAENGDTFVSGLEFLPAYIAAKSENDQFNMKFINLLKLAEQNYSHPFINSTLRLEAQELHRFLTRHIITPAQMHFATRN